MDWNLLMLYAAIAVVLLPFCAAVGAIARKAGWWK